MKKYLLLFLGLSLLSCGLIEDFVDHKQEDPWYPLEIISQKDSIAFTDFLIKNNLKKNMRSQITNIVDSHIISINVQADSLFTGNIVLTHSLSELPKLKSIFLNSQSVSKILIEDSIFFPNIKKILFEYNKIDSFPTNLLKVMQPDLISFLGNKIKYFPDLSNYSFPINILIHDNEICSLDSTTATYLDKVSPNWKETQRCPNGVVIK